MSRMNYKTGPIAWVVYALLRVVFAMLQMFPLEWNLQTARILARLWARFIPRHRRLAKKHLLDAYGSSLSDAEADRLAMRCLECVTMFAVEAICLPPLITSSNWGRYVRLVNFKDALELLVQGRGVILVTGHYGAFELTGHLLACLGFDIVGVMRPLDNEYLNRYLVQSRQTHGLRLIDKKGATEQAEKYLDDGFLLGFVGDQDAGRKGLFVQFFGQPASTYKSIGLLAMTKGAPIVVGYVRRDGDRARYDLGVQRIIYPHEWADKPDPLRWITQEYTSAIEQFVRDEPTQYLWIHRRWKSKRKEKGARISAAEKAGT